MKMKSKGYVLIVLAVVELSLLPVFTGLGIINTSVPQFLFYTFLVGTAVSFLALIAARRLGNLFRIFSNRRAFFILLAAGAINYAVAQLLIAIAIKGTNPVVVTLITKLWPIIMAIMLPFTIRLKSNKAQILALAVGFIGVYILAAHGFSLRLFGVTYIGIALLSTVATAGSNIMIRGQNQDTFSQVFLFNFISLIFMSLVIFAFGIDFFPMNLSTIVSFLFIGGISYSLGALMFFYTLKMFDPLLMSGATYAIPALTIVFSYLILGTKFYPYYGISFALIILALVIQQYYSRSAPKYAARKHVHLPLFDISGAFINTKNNEVINLIERSGRALAVKYPKEIKIDEPSKYGCLVFTAKNHRGYANPEELQFIKEVVGAKENEDVLVCIGKPDDAERAISDYLERFEHIPDLQNPNPNNLGKDINL